MTLPPLHKAAGLHLSWVGGLCGAVILMLKDFLPFRLPFTSPADFLTCVVLLEIFFVLLVWPFFVPSLLRETPEPPLLLFTIGILILFALPIVLIAGNVAGAGGGEIVRSQAQVAALAVLAAGVAAFGHAKEKPVLPWYFLAVFWISAAQPFWSFLENQIGSKAPGGFAYLSPFWAASRTESGPAWVQVVVFGLGGVALLALSRRRRTA